jgi:uncharacterized protein YybS (DUF2232 family)
MSKDMLIAIGAGVTSGFASLAFLSGMPGALLVVYLAPLPLLLVGLDQGLKAGTIAGASGIVTSTIAGNLLSGGFFAIIHVFPSWIIVKQGLLRYPVPGAEKEEWYPLGSILCILSVFSAVTLIVASFWYQGEFDGLQGLIRSYLDQVFLHLRPMDEAARSGLVQLISPLFPGYMGTSWIIMVVFNASIAMTILTRAKRIVRPKTKLANLMLPDWMSWFIVVSASVMLLGQKELEFFSQNLTLILAVPFFFLGLAVLHKLASYVTFPRVLLSSFYLALILSGWIALIITFAGIVEQWFGLRRYFKNYS